MALIEREDAIKAALDWKVKPDDEVFAAIKTAITSNLEQLAAVDAAPVVHGRWIDHKDEHQCSECKEITIVDFYVWKNVQFDYCPYCGVKMDGDRNVHTKA
jgi:hypothetical protein